MDSLRVLHTFDPGLTDFGYPVATQFDDGSTLCAFYGYSTDQADPWGTPHAVYVAMFNESWLEKTGTDVVLAPAVRSAGEGPGGGSQ